MHPPGQTSSTKLYSVHLVKNEHGDKVAAAVIGYVKVGLPITSVGHWKCIVMQLTDNGATTQQKRPWRPRDLHSASADPKKKKIVCHELKLSAFSFMRKMLFSCFSIFFKRWKSKGANCFLLASVQFAFSDLQLYCQWCSSSLFACVVQTLFSACRSQFARCERPLSVCPFFVPSDSFLLAYLVWRCEGVKVRPLRIQDLKCRSNQMHSSTDAPLFPINVFAVTTCRLWMLWLTSSFAELTFCREKVCSGWSL